MAAPQGRVTGTQTTFHVTTTAPAASNGKPTPTEAAAGSADANQFAKTTDWTAPTQSVETQDQNFYGQETADSYSGQPTWEPMRLTVLIDHSNTIHAKMIGLNATPYVIGDTLHVYAKTTKGSNIVYRYYKTEWAGFSEAIPVNDGATAEAVFAVQDRFILTNA